MDNVENKNPVDTLGKTLLHEAAEMGQFDVCKLILENVEDKNPSDIFGETPLNIAKERKNQKIVKLISSYI